MQEDIGDIMNSARRMEIIQSTIDKSFEYCIPDHCPYLANKSFDEILIDVDKIPDYPTELYLAYEGKCNYHCTCCTAHLNMKDTMDNDYEENYKAISDKIEKILPYVKKISANGRGELFCSNHILNILSNWKPISPAEEIRVALETNGSLFNETNWEKIANLGQYYLHVNITVMSFREDIYQFLSGTTLPIDNIIDNLHFVKSLREKGIINSFKVTTVLQEQNFRDTPEFAKRCIEEFGVDKVSFRPIFPGGPYPKHIQWFMDVRNPKHPYYNEYKKVMQNEIFKHPKVLLFSGDLDSNIGDYPGAIQ